MDVFATPPHAVTSFQNTVPPMAPLPPPVMMSSPPPPPSPAEGGIQNYDLSKLDERIRAMKNAGKLKVSEKLNLD